MADTASLKKAVEILRRAERLAPDRLEVRRRLAQTLVGLGDRGQARREFLWLSEHFRNEGNLLEAREHLERWLQEAPEDAEAGQRLAALYEESGESVRAASLYYQTATRLLAENKTTSARSALEKAVRLDAGQTEYRKTLIDLHERIGEQEHVFEERLSLAEALFQQGKVQEAREECRGIQQQAKADRKHLEHLADLCVRLEEKPLAYSLYLELAHQFQQAGRMESAAEFAHKAQASVPDESSTYDFLVDLYLKEDRRAEAVAQLRQLADLYRRKKSISRLTGVLRKVLSFDPDETAAREELVECFTRQENTEAANRQRTELARVYRRQGRMAEALHQYTRVLEKQPFHLPLLTEAAELQIESGHPEAALQFYLEQAQSLDRLGARPEAEKLLLQALEIDPERFAVLESLADLYRRMERREAAIERFEQVVAIHLKKENRDEAIRALTQVAELAPQRTEVWSRLAELHLASGQEGRAIEIWSAEAGRLSAAGQGEMAERILLNALEQLPDEAVLQDALILLYERNNRKTDLAASRLRFAERMIVSDRLSEAAEHLEKAVPHLEDPTEALQQLVALSDRLEQSDRKETSLRHLAREYRQKRDWNRLAPVLEQLLELDSEDLESLRWLAETRQEAGDEEGSRQAWIRLADLLSDRRRHGEAVEIYRNMIQSDPENRAIREKLVEALMRMQARTEAAQELVELARWAQRERTAGQAYEYYRKALSLEPDGVGIRREYADVLWEAERKDAALEQLMKLADTYEALTMREKAIETLRTVRERWPEDLRIARKLAGLYLADGLRRSAAKELLAVADNLIEQEEYAGAGQTLEELIELEPESTQARGRLGEVLLHLGQPEEASVQFFRAARQLADTGKMDEASRMLESIKALPPEWEAQRESLERDLDSTLRRSSLTTRLEQAESLAKKKDAEAAVRAYEGILQDEPANIDALLGLARLKHEAGSPEESRALFLEAAGHCRNAGQIRRAATLLQDVLNIWPEFDTALERLLEVEEAGGRMEEARQTTLRLARLRQKQGRVDLAIQLSEKVLTTDRANAEARKQLAEMLLVLDRNEEAQQHLVALGEIQKERNQIESAVESFRKAAEMIPEDGQSRMKLAELLDQIGRQDEAIRESLRAAESFWNAGHREQARRLSQTLLERVPEHAGCLEQAVWFAEQAGEEKEAVRLRKKQADLLLQSKKTSEAVSLLQKIVEKSPSDLVVRRTLAEQLESLGRSGQAVEQYLQIARLYQEKGISGKAISYFRLAQKGMEDPLPIQRKIADMFLKENLQEKAITEFLTLADALFQQERYEEAAESLEQIIDVESGNLRALNKLAACYELSGHHEKSSGVFRQIVETYMDRGILSKAVEAARKGLESAPYDIGLRERLADLLTRKGDYEAAKQEYTFLLQDNPGDIRLTTLVNQLKKKISGEGDKGAPGKGLSTPRVSTGPAFDPYGPPIQAPAEEAMSARAEEGIRLFERKRYPAAIEQLKAAVNLWRQTPSRGEEAFDYLNVLGCCYLETRKPEDAVRVLEEGLKVGARKEDKELLEIRYNLARALEMLDQNEDALNLWKAIYNVDRSYRDVANKILWSRIALRKK